MDILSLILSTGGVGVRISLAPLSKDLRPDVTSEWLNQNPGILGTGRGKVSCLPYQSFLSNSDTSFTTPHKNTYQHRHMRNYYLILKTKQNTTQVDLSPFKWYFCRISEMWAPATTQCWAPPELALCSRRRALSSHLGQEVLPGALWPPWLLHTIVLELRGFLFFCFS